MKNNWANNIGNILKNGFTEEHKIFARRYARKAKYHINHTIKGFIPLSTCRLTSSLSG
jgi:hypothetical protein